MEYTAQNLEYAVSVFYNGEQEDRAKAHAWLTAAQRVSEAWTFVWDLLQPSKGTEIQFYAATTLHTKILRCWNEVPPEMYPQLKEKLLQSVIGYSKGPKIVTNRLCISLAAFILQQGSVDLADTLRPLSAAENTSLLLEVLTVIPEEYNSMTMGTTLRQKNRAALNQASKMVLDDMLRYLQSVYNDYSKDPPSEDTIQSWTVAATCAASWLSLGEEDAVDCGTTLPERAPLYRALLAAVHVICRWNEAVSDSALEACEACLSAVRAAGTAGGASRHGDAARDLLASVSELATPLFTANNVPNSINEELLSALITCCVSISECHSRVIVHAVEGGAAQGEGGSAMLRLLLAAQAAPGHYPLHETRSNLVFGIWYTLQDEILNANVDKNPVWREVFTQLLLTLVKKSEMPPESALSKDDQELLRCYRQDIADIVMYCFTFLGETCWSLVESVYTGEASGVTGNNGAPGAATVTGAGNRAAQREAALHVCLALADMAGQGAAPAPLLQHALHCVADMNEDVRVLHTALDCLGAYASWLNEQRACAALSALARAAVRAAGGALARCPAPAALALRRLAHDCSAPAAELVVDIVRVAQAQCTSGSLDAWSRRQLLSAASAALAASAPDRSAPLLRDLALTLREMLLTQISSGGAVCAGEVLSLMGALGARPDLAAALYRALHPALLHMLSPAKMPHPVFQILKHTVSAMMCDILTVIEDISDLTIAGFEIEPCPVGLEVIKLVTVLVGNEWEGACKLVRAGVLSSARAISPQHAHVPANTQGHAHTCAAPDLADALFTLLVALTKKQAQSIDWLEDLLPDLVDLACSCVRVWEARAASAACAWLSALAQRRAPALQRAAPALTHTALHCIGGATPRNQMEPLAGLLLALNRAQWNEGEAEGGGVGGAGGEFGVWMRAALARAGFPSAHATDAHKQKFIQAVLKEKKSKRRLLESVQEFSLACRGLIGTEYARQSLTSKQMVA